MVIRSCEDWTDERFFTQVLFALVFAFSVNLLELVLFEILGVLSYRCGGSVLIYWYKACKCDTFFHNKRGQSLTKDVSAVYDG